MWELEAGTTGISQMNWTSNMDYDPFRTLEPLKFNMRRYQHLMTAEIPCLYVTVHMKPTLLVKSISTRAVNSGRLI